MRGRPDVLGAPAIDVTRPVDWTAWADDPYPLYRRLRDEAPVYWDEPNQTYVLTRHDDVYAVLMDHKRYSSVPLDILEGRQPPTSEIRQQDEPRHRFIRNTVGPLFNPPAMRRREDVIRAIVQDLVDRSEEHEIVEVSTMLATPLPAAVVLGLIGLPLEQHDAFHRLMEERLAFLLTRGSRAESSPESLERFAAIRAEMWEIVVPLIDERRRDPQPDAITRILETQDEVGKDELSDDVFLNMLLERHHAFHRLMEERLTFLLTRGSRAESSPEALARFAAIRAEMWEIVVPLIEARRRDPQPDAITRILETQDEVGKEELSDDVFLNMLLELVTGGFETTQHLIESLLDHVCDRPELWARLRADRVLASGCGSAASPRSPSARACGRRASGSKARGGRRDGRRATRSGAGSSRTRP